MSDVSDEARSGSPDLDAVVIGAGFSGLYMLYRLRKEMGLSARVYEAGGGVGGTWYWNQYPGARCDSDSYVYCYFFDRDLWQEWEWSERYPEQHEVLSSWSTLLIASTSSAISSSTPRSRPRRSMSPRTRGRSLPMRASRSRRRI